MMKKRLIAYMLFLVLLLTWIPCEARAAELPDLGNLFGYMEKHIEINYNGAIHNANVLMADGKTILAPISWLTYYGGMTAVENGDGSWKYSYLYQTEERNFAERIYIDTKNGSFENGVYFDNDILLEMILAADGLRIEAEGLTFRSGDKEYEAEAIVLTDQGVIFDVDGDGVDVRDLKLSADAPLNWCQALWEGIPFTCCTDTGMTLLTIPEFMMERLLDDYFANEDAEIKRVHGTDYLMYGGTFSSWMTYQGEFWAPIEEVLALLDASVVIEDGVLYLSPASMTTLRALYLHAEDMEKYLFDADDLDWKEVRQVGGYVISTVTDYRFDRLLLTQEGAVNDYEAIFERLLVDNEAYLSLYGYDQSPNQDFFNSMQTISGNSSSIFDMFDTTSTGYGMYINSLVNYQETAPGLYSAMEDIGDVAGMAVDAYTSAVEYMAAYETQIQDHREMLGAVYEYAVEEKILVDRAAPSYRAAVNVSAKYGEDESLRLLAATEDWMFEFFSEEVGRSLAAKALGPWCLAIDAGRLVFPELYEDFTNNGQLGFWDYAVQTAYEVYEDRITSRTFSKDGLEELRLSAMMAMVASRNAYRVLEDGRLHPGILEIDKALNHLYLAGCWTVDGTDAYEQSQRYIGADVDALWVGDGFDAPLRPKYAAVPAELMLYCTALRNAYGEQLLLDCGLDENGYPCILTFETAGGTEKASWMADIGNLAVAQNGAQGSSAYGNPDMTEICIDGNLAELHKQLQAYFYFREGVELTQQTDVDGDGDLDGIWVVSDAAQLWENCGGPQLSGENLTVLVAESRDDSIRLRAWHLETDGAAEAVSISISGGNLEVQPSGDRYTYQREGVPYVKADSGKTESGCTVEQLLAEGVECLMGVGGSFVYEDPLDPTFGTAYLNGDELVIYLDGSGKQIQRLSVWAEENGCAVITDGVTTDMTIGQLKQNWRATSVWSDMIYEFPYGGSDPMEDICEISIMFYWWPGPEGCYKVTLHINSADYINGYAQEDLTVGIYVFERVEVNQDIMGWFEGQ